MKTKSHSGLKKRLRIRKSGSLATQKASKRHLLANKSKRQKHLGKHSLPLDKTLHRAAKRLLPGKKIK